MNFCSFKLDFSVFFMFSRQKICSPISSHRRLYSWILCSGSASSVFYCNTPEISCAFLFKSSSVCSGRCPQHHRHGLSPSAAGHPHPGPSVPGGRGGTSSLFTINLFWNVLLKHLLKRKIIMYFVLHLTQTWLEIVLFLIPQEMETDKNEDDEKKKKKGRVLCCFFAFSHVTCRCTGQRK